MNSLSEARVGAALFPAFGDRPLCMTRDAEGAVGRCRSSFYTRWNPLLGLHAGKEALHSSQ